jgi:ABC-type phosphate transport system auxiliary subunit
MTEKPTLREEFRLWWRSAPRVWVIIAAVVVAAFVFRGTLDLIASIAFLIFFVLFLVSIVPAIVGALAGKAVGGVIRKVRYPRDTRFVQNPIVLPRRQGSK